jgi:hypothetical protein
VPERRLQNPLGGASHAAPALLEGAATSERERIEMAAQGDADKELTVHRQGYEKFISMFRIGAVICAIIAFIVVLLIRK